ncbi:NAD-dependent epimerase/dehydratase family protein [Montanilutibacter psychrotolerans]|uniref:NAD-dependent epimerase/dehydratase family protein n=1 Tax=Montanilutibacter psychrotolerans TaxID=1327343 RepID=A0A3M8SU00_9GAMM|nr:NAD-dependent epimerase/dehydratase family protein [Lysobacter psychrotolerans]RNF84263.1 NAD-dependent epimerase/dehydratase family protein [Lysobacter psychrotolerans]
MRVAVTGASGFIGRQVVRELVARGAAVVAVSRRPDPPVSDAVTPLAMDIAAPGQAPFERLGRPDVLLHLAWGGLPNYHSAHHLDTEFPAHAAFLDACLDAGLQRLVVAGTCLEYGLQSGELDEAMSASPVTAYGQAKAALHQHLVERGQDRGFGLAWLRLFYLYGPGQAASSLYAQLRAAVASNARTFDMSNGDQVRDFLPIETAAAHIAAIALGHADAGTVNICSGHPATVTDTVRGWLREWDADIALNRGVYAYPDYEPFAFWGSTRRLHSLLETT